MLATLLAIISVLRNTIYKFIRGEGEGRRLSGRKDERWRSKAQDSPGLVCRWRGGKEGGVGWLGGGEQEQEERGGLSQ